MTKPFRFASAASLVALSTMIAGCASPQQRVTTSGFGGRAGGEIGLATRAAAALAANDVANAVSFAERAVEKTPNDAGFRALLGNTYFASGRFASAEAAYKDALALYPDQPQVVLKLALVEIAQGKNAEAVNFLGANERALDPANFGLALALAGHAADAIPLLENSARAHGADAQVRQNLALAYAFIGEWTNARTIAAQDVPADQLDARLQQWMRLAKPTRPSDQVAALTGVTPAAADPGQPARLALRRTETRQAEAAPIPAPTPVVPAPQPQPQVAAYSPAPPPPPAREPARIVAEASKPAPAPLTASEPARIVAKAPKPAPAPLTVAEVAAAAPEAPAVFAAAIAPKVAAPAPTPPRLTRAAVTVKLPPARNPVLHAGKSTAVVQLGAYGSRDRVAVAWQQLTKRYPKLRDYAPMTARFESTKGTVYRLSVRGFASQREAIARCNLLKGNGGACFVRNVAGDAPIQIASR
ncbi:MAG: tetratricopeptide repeat protein [Sphingomicrobium sp.]